MTSYRWLSLAAFVLACASFQVGSEVNLGRQTLLIGNHESALAYFHSAAQKDPNYMYGTALRQGIWSYVGRTEYANGRLPQAQESLERALTANPDEPITRLYLGLTLARAGESRERNRDGDGGSRHMHNPAN